MTHFRGHPNRREDAPGVFDGEARCTKEAAVIHAGVQGRGGASHHTDRGSPYASDEYRNGLTAYAMLASMSRTGDCWDNAVAESFFATLRAELVDDERYQTRGEAERSIGDYIETFYNTERLHSHLDYVSPIEFELKTRIMSITQQTQSCDVRA